MILIGLVLSACTGNLVENVPATSSEELPLQPQDNLNPNSESEQSNMGDPLPETDQEGKDKSPPLEPAFEQDYGPNEISDRDYSDLEIITLLPKDGIRSIDDAEYYPVNEANQEYSPEELVIGDEFNGDARAYSVSLLSRHEIVNDTVGGIKIAVTW